METIFTSFVLSEVKSAAEQPMKKGELAVYRSPQSGQEMRGRVKDLHECGFIIFRETVPLGTVPAGWEPAQFMADPKNIFPAY